jgi:pimeloyl-ACP methyl ester carboxylesterase
MVGLAILLAGAMAPVKVAPPPVRMIAVGQGIELHYVELGQGDPVIFVHGSLSDFSYWEDQLPVFAATYRAITYSRRYNRPNSNPPRPGYSAVVDADDLAALIMKLHLGKVHVIGHSYGALTALFLAVRHPEMIRTLVLAEAPAVSLLAHLKGDRAVTGKATLADIQEHMVKPMQAAFRRGDREAGLRAFLAYVLDDPQAWDKMPPPARQETLSNVHEWEVMMTTGELFPELDPEAVRKIRMPLLLLSGEKSYGFLGLIDKELQHLLPAGRRIVLPGASHRMWFEQPEVCRQAVLDFWNAVQRRPRPSDPPLGRLRPPPWDRTTSPRMIVELRAAR